MCYQQWDKLQQSLMQQDRHSHGPSLSTSNSVKLLQNTRHQSELLDIRPRPSQQSHNHNPSMTKSDQYQYHKIGHQQSLYDDYLIAENNSPVRKKRTVEQNPNISGTGPRNSVFNINAFLEGFKEKISSSRKNSENQSPQRQRGRSNVNLSRRQLIQGTITIPDLPQVSSVTLNILSNWGDASFVGLKAIQFFDEQGVSKLPDSNRPDSRDLSNLINGNVFTKCDQQFWLVPFTEPVLLNFVFRQRFRLAMIRIWNYNKSGYTSRGVKKITLCTQALSLPIFCEDIMKAEGWLKDYHKTAQYLLFTSSLKVIENINANDWLGNYDFSHLDEDPELPNQQTEAITIYPLQGLYNCRFLITVEILQNFGDPGYCAYEKLRFYNNSGNLIKHKCKTNRDKIMTNPPLPIEFSILQPTIIQKVVIKCPDNQAGLQRVRILFDTEHEYCLNLQNTAVEQQFLFNSSIKYRLSTPDNTVRFGKEVKLILHHNWGGKRIGLNKFEIFDIHNTSLLNSRQIPYYVSQNLKYLSTAAFEPWRQWSLQDNISVPHNQEQPVQLVVKFQSIVLFGAIVIWNSLQTQDGIKEIQIKIDDKIVYQGYFSPYEGKCQVVLLTVQDNVHDYFISQPKQFKFNQLVTFNNEGAIGYIQK